MAIITLNEYKAVTSENKEIVICALKLSDAALALESGTVSLDQVSVSREGIQVVVEDPVV